MSFVLTKLSLLSAVPSALVRSVLPASRQSVRAIKMCSSADTSGIDVEGLLTTKLTDKFSPAELQVINESYMHNVPKGAQSHFKVIVVSDQFKGQTLLNRHRAVQDAVKDEIANYIHAFSITAKTPEEWAKVDPGSLKSPACLGGMKHEAKLAS